MTNACPRCGAQLAPLQAGAFTLGACRACAGVFAPSAATAHLAQKLDEEMAAAVTQVSMGSTDMSSMPDGSPALPCPTCGAAMNRVVVSETSLDTCIMHGTWFDAWELERVLRARAAELQASSKPWVATGTRKEIAETPPLVYTSAASVGSNVSEGVGMAAAEVAGNVVMSGAAELAVEGVFAIIMAIFD
jgi:Zn-finger nucleic acid-binding protein